MDVFILLLSLVVIAVIAFATYKKHLARLKKRRDQDDPSG